MKKMNLRQNVFNFILPTKAETNSRTSLLRFDNVTEPKILKLFIPLLLFVISLMAASTTRAATYYLNSTTGLDTNPGTSTLPWKTIQRALPNYTGDGVKVTQGDTVMIAPGNYGSLVYDLNGNAQRTNWITYQGSDPANKPYFSGFNIDDAANAYLKFVNIHILVDYPAAGESKTETGFVTGSSYILFSNCDLFGLPSTGNQYYGVYVGSSHYITFEDCEMKWGAYIVLVDGVSVGECTNITFRRCYIHDTVDDGMYLRGITNLTIEDCIIHNVNTQYSINHQDNIALDDVSNLIFRRNIIYVDPDKTSLAQGLYSCLDFGGSNENFLIENNLFYGKYYGRPLCLWYVDGLVLANNTWDSISVSAISASCTLMGCTNVKIYNNVFGTLNYDTYNGSVKYSSTFDAYPDKDYNIHERYSGSNIGPHSLDLTAVRFVNDYIGDYHLADNSVAIDFGIDNSYTPQDDLDQVARDTRPDAGCYEYGGTPIPDTTPPAIVSVSPYKNSVEITFDEMLNADSAQNIGNYSINNRIEITDASLDAALSKVTLTTTDHTDGVTYTLTVNNVEDLAGNAIPLTTLNYTYQYDSGLVAYWKLDDGTGSTAEDASDTGNTGILINEPNWTAGRFHGAISLDELDQAIEVATTDFDSTKGAISLWAYPTALPSVAQFLFGHVADGWANRIQIYTNNAEGGLGIGLGDTHLRATNIHNLQTQNWYHIVLTWDEPSYTVYVDGDQQAAGTYSGLSTLSTYADLGNTGNRSDRMEAFSGIIDEVQIYNRSLTATEVSNLFNQIPQLFSPIGDKQVYEGQNLSFAIETLDPNIQVLIQDHNLPSEPDLTDNIFSWTPDYDDAGSYETTFIAQSGEIEDFETISITVSNSNMAPVIEPIADQQVDETDLLTFAVNFYDPDGDDVSCTADNLPAGATFTDNIFEWTPTLDQAGTYIISFIASDGELEDVESALITVNNINQRPNLEPIPDQSIDEGRTLTITVNASDPDGDTLIYYVFNAPAGSLFTDDTFSWTPNYDQAGTYWVFFVVFDGITSAWDLVVISVNDVTAPPPSDIEGRVGYWKFDEGGGTTAQDSSDTGNTATLIDSPIWTTGKFGTAIQFQTTDQAVEVATTNWNLTGGTIALWAYPTDFPSVTQFLFGHVAAGWANRIQIYTNTAEGGLGIGLGDTHRRATDIFDMDIGIWYHIVLTWNGTNYVVYVNGTQQAAGTYTGLSTLSSYADIANTGYRTDRHEAFSGIVDEVQIYDRPLTADEVMEIFSYNGL